MILNSLFVFIGGGIGCVLRFSANNIFSKFFGEKLYFATFTVNFIGSFILGMAFMFFALKPELPQPVKFAITVGLCGGLTTFSTFSLELFSMIRENQLIFAFLYSFLSIIACLIGVFLGIFIIKSYF